MMKRNLDHAIAARSYHAQNREMLLLAITHNITIVVLMKIVVGFSTEQDKTVFHFVPEASVPASPLIPINNHDLFERFTL